MARSLPSPQRPIRLIGVKSLGDADSLSITDCHYDLLSFNEELTIPGPPRAGTFNGNLVLNGWFNDNPVGHVFTSKEEVYLVSNGTECFKIQIAGYNDGVYQMHSHVLPAAPIESTKSTF